MGKSVNKKTLSLKALNRKNVWDLQEQDVFAMFSMADHDIEIRDNKYYFLDVLRSAFTIEEIPNFTSSVKNKFEREGFKVGRIRMKGSEKTTWAVKKHTITRLGEISRDNIHYVSVENLIEILQYNFGGGWGDLPKSVQEMIESNFDVVSIMLPATNFDKKNNTYKEKKAAGYEVLEVPKGTWVELIFVRAKTVIDYSNENLYKTKDNKTYNIDNASDDDFGESDTDTSNISPEDMMIEDNYRTTFDIEDSQDEEEENFEDTTSED